MVGLSGKVAVATDSAIGVGRVFAEGFSQARSNMMIADIDDAKAQNTCLEIIKTGVRANAVKCDVRQSEDADNLISQCNYEK